MEPLDKGVCEPHEKLTFPQINNAQLRVTKKIFSAAGRPGPLGCSARMPIYRGNKCCTKAPSQQNNCTTYSGSLQMLQFFF